MLNTDICLLYDVEDGANRNCCTRTDAFRPDGTSRCPSFPNRECATIDPNSNHPRAEAAAAVRRYLGGMTVNDNQQPFYDAFSQAWFKGEEFGWVLEPFVLISLTSLFVNSHDERFLGPQVRQGYMLMDLACPSCNAIDAFGLDMSRAVE